jgi:uncharacterized protein YjbI with pentapeptide repeats
VSRPAGRGPAGDRRLVLPELTPFAGDGLEPRHDYDTTDFVERDFAGQDGPDIRFLESRLQRCNLDDASLRRARILGSLLEGVTAATIDLADSTWRDSEVVGGRLGAVNLAGANLTRVRFQGTRLGFLNLAGGQLDEVRFEGCEIDGIDARAGQLRALSFVDCAIGELNVTEARLTRVDLSGARLRSLVGVDNLRGAIISRAQLLDLAPLLAEQLGLEVRPD